MISSTSAVARCTPIDGSDFEPTAKAESGRSTTKKSESPIRSARLRSLPRATSTATNVLTIAKTYEIAARSVTGTGPPGYTPSRTPAATNRRDAKSISRTIGRSSPATTSPLPRRANVRRSSACSVSLGGSDLSARFERVDVLGRDKHATEIRAVISAAMEVRTTRRHEVVTRRKAKTERGPRGCV